MRKIIVSLLISVGLLLPRISHANEGMWFLMFLKNLNERDMQKKGLKLTAEEIYSINNSSLKDAIVQFDGGCTASIISKDGLVLTNHHCGYEQIAELSTPENNYLRDGYWAENYQKELKPKSLSVRFFVRMDNVTDRMLSVVNDKMTEEERNTALGQEMEKIQKENNEGGKYVVSVRSFFEGNEFYYFVYQDFNDVRFVGTPPESIGKFGGDTDNWEWPRQTGDFSVFRVYTDKNGNAAEYSPENIPMKTKNYLKVNIGGVKENDFAMILGYPGKTNRWESSFWVEQKVNYAYPAWVEASKNVMDAMKPFMDADDKTRLLYASKYAQIANYWKNRDGMIKALTQHKTAQTKRQIEKKFNQWANRKENKAQYGEIIGTMKNYFEATNQKSSDENYLMAIFRGSDFVGIPMSLAETLASFSTLPSETQTNIKNRILIAFEKFLSEKSIELEKEVLIKGVELYAKKSKEIAPKVKEIQQEYNGDFRKFFNQTFEKSIFGSKENLEKFFENPDANLVNNDPLLQLAQSLITQYYQKDEKLIAQEDAYKKAFRKFVQGLRVSKIGTTLYPDANSTLRLTYGSVRALPYDHRNPDVEKNNHTTFKTMVAKYIPNDPEFGMPSRMIQMYHEKDFGRYADKDGKLHINFLTDNDITGGNSGSPVLNGKGELIGLAFDGNIEAMAGDVIFDHKLQRTINVDVRYILWVIEKFSNAKHIVDELTIVE